MLLQIIFVSLGLSATALGDQPLEAAVSMVVAQPVDVRQQEKILQLLPTFFNRPAELGELLDHLRYDLFDSSHCRLLTRTALRLEREYDLNPKMSIFPLHVRRSELHGWITYRIKQLVLPDVGAFDDPGNAEPAKDGFPADEMREIGPRSDFWNKLITWTEKHKIESTAIDDIKAEIAAFHAQNNADWPLNNSPEGLRAKSPKIVSRSPANQAGEVGPQPESSHSRHSSPSGWWIGAGILIVTAVYLWRFQFKKRS